MRALFTFVTASFVFCACYIGGGGNPDAATDAATDADGAGGVDAGVVAPDAGVVTPDAKPYG